MPDLFSEEWELRIDLWGAVSADRQRDLFKHLNITKLIRNKDVFQHLATAIPLQSYYTWILCQVWCFANFLHLDSINKINLFPFFLGDRKTAALKFTRYALQLLNSYQPSVRVDIWLCPVRKWWRHMIIWSQIECGVADPQPDGNVRCPLLLLFAVFIPSST